MRRPALTNTQSFDSDLIAPVNVPIHVAPLVHMPVYVPVPAPAHVPAIVPRYRESRGFLHKRLVECRYCCAPIAPPRRTFCSARCVDQYRLRTDGNYLRQRVFERDNGICAICAIDTKEIAELIFSAGNQVGAEIRAQYQIPVSRKITTTRNGGGLWDADHIVPVKHGGGQCGLDNMRTLCIRCHKIITFSK